MIEFGAREQNKGKATKAPSLPQMWCSPSVTLETLKLSTAQRVNEGVGDDVFRWLVIGAGGHGLTDGSGMLGIGRGVVAGDDLARALVGCRSRGWCQCEARGVKLVKVRTLPRRGGAVISLLCSVCIHPT
jgi:hypothetical protein